MDKPWILIEEAPLKKELLLFRSDSRTMEVGKVDKRYVGNPHYAYTHFKYLPEKPEAITPYRKKDN